MGQCKALKGGAQHPSPQFWDVTPAHEQHKGFVREQLGFVKVSVFIFVVFSQNPEVRCYSNQGH